MSHKTNWNTRKIDLSTPVYIIIEKKSCEIFLRVLYNSDEKIDNSNRYVNKEVPTWGVCTLLNKNIIIKK